MSPNSFWIKGRNKDNGYNPKSLYLAVCFQWTQRFCHDFLGDRAMVLFAFYDRHKLRASQTDDGRMGRFAMKRALVRVTFDRSVCPDDTDSLVLLALTAARLPGRITPITGIVSCSLISSRATAVAVLQAITNILIFF